MINSASFPQDVPFFLDYVIFRSLHERPNRTSPSICSTTFKTFKVF